MFEFLTEELEIKKRKKPIKLSQRDDFIGIVIILMFGVFTKRNSLEEGLIINILNKLNLIKVSDINNLKVLNLLYCDGIIDYYSNKNIKLTNAGKEFNKYIIKNKLFSELQDQLRGLL